VAHGGDGAASPDTGKSFDTFYGVNPQTALAIEAEKMKAFKKRVDDLLILLDGSEAAPGKMGEGRLAYWTIDEKRAADPAGHLALAPLAITCLAYDAGFPIEVESGYLPHHLLTRGWLGEFPT
jgi:hypothetical protein